MANPYPASFIDQNNEGRLVGLLDFTDTGNQPGGSTAVGALLGLPNIDAHASGTYPLTWDSLHDDPFAFNPLVAIPAGLGLTFLFNGTDATITTTASGVWAFTLAFQVPADDAWTGVLQLDGNLASAQSGNVSPAATGSGNDFTLCEVVKYPAGASIVPQLNTTHAGTANPLNASGFLEIVRLA